MLSKDKFLLMTILAAFPCAASTPTVVNVVPNHGSGFTQTFAANFTDPSGYADIQAAYLYFGAGPTRTNGCLVVYEGYYRQFQLFDDNNALISGWITPGTHGSTMLFNSQCALTGANVQGSGNNLTVSVDITFFEPALMDLKRLIARSLQIYGNAQDFNGNSLGWQSLGNWSHDKPMVAALSVTPNNATGLRPQTFQAVFTDSDGADDLLWVDLFFGTSVNDTQGCRVGYRRDVNVLFLSNDANTEYLPAIVAGSSSHVQNSRCVLYGDGGPPLPLGSILDKNLTVPFRLAFLKTFTGMKFIYGSAQGYFGPGGGVQWLGILTP